MMRRQARPTRLHESSIEHHYFPEQAPLMETETLAAAQQIDFSLLALFFRAACRRLLLRPRPGSGALRFLFLPLCLRFLTRAAGFRFLSLAARPGVPGLALLFGSSSRVFRAPLLLFGAQPLCLRSLFVCGALPFRFCPLLFLCDPSPLRLRSLLFLRGASLLLL